MCSFRKKFDKKKIFKTIVTADRPCRKAYYEDDVFKISMEKNKQF